MAQVSTYLIRDDTIARRLNLGDDIEIVAAYGQKMDTIGYVDTCYINGVGYGPLLEEAYSQGLRKFPPCGGQIALMYTDGVDLIIGIDCTGHDTKFSKE